jgi:hypothetical protein
MFFHTDNHGENLASVSLEIVHWLQNYFLLSLQYVTPVELFMDFYKYFFYFLKFFWLLSRNVVLIVVLQSFWTPEIMGPRKKT